MRQRRRYLFYLKGSLPCHSKTVWIRVKRSMPIRCKILWGPRYQMLQSHILLVVERYSWYSSTQLHISTLWKEWMRTISFRHCIHSKRIRPKWSQGQCWIRTHEERLQGLSLIFCVQICYLRSQERIANLLATFLEALIYSEFLLFLTFSFALPKFDWLSSLL